MTIATPGVKPPVPATPPRLLIVEDDEGLASQLRWSFDGYDVVVAGDRAGAIAALRSHEPDVVTLDLGLPPDPDGVSEGLATLAEIIRLKPDCKVVVASGHGDRSSARAAIAGGAWDFYQKPIDQDTLALIVARAAHVRVLEQENARLTSEAGEDHRVLGRIVTGAPAMMKLARTVERVAPTNVSVMLLGASGSGKELVARGLHDASNHARGAFVALNCAAIPENLLESELFGFEKGAFTGAVKATEGKIEQAHGGTLFLDEVGDMPLGVQVKLLRFLQERVIERVGGRRPIPVDTRVVCATHRDIDAMVAAETFREDLYYRLAEVVLRLPALSERPGDAVLLARYFIRRFAAELNPQVRGLSPDAAAAIDGWSWPGNVRELENRIKRAVIMADGRLVTADDLDLDGARAGGSAPVAGTASTEAGFLNLRAAREAADRAAIARAMAQSDGNVSGAAKLLGISRPTLYDLFRQYGLQD